MRAVSSRILITGVILGTLILLADARYNSKLRWHIGAALIAAERWVPEVLTLPVKRVIRISASRARPEDAGSYLQNWGDKTAQADLLSLVAGGAVDPDLPLDGTSLLVEAVYLRADKVVSMLVERGADILSPTADGPPIVDQMIGECRIRVLRTIERMHLLQTLPEEERTRLKALARQTVCSFWNHVFGVDSPLAITLPAREITPSFPPGRLLVSGFVREPENDGFIADRGRIAVFDGKGNEILRSPTESFVTFLTALPEVTLALSSQPGDTTSELLLIDRDGRTSLRKPVPVQPYSIGGGFFGGPAPRIVLALPHGATPSLAAFTYPELSPAPDLPPITLPPRAFAALQLFQTKSGQLVQYAVSTLDTEAGLGAPFEAEYRERARPSISRVSSHTLTVAGEANDDRWVAVSEEPDGLAVIFWDGVKELKHVPLAPDFAAAKRFGHPSVCLAPGGRSAVVAIGYGGGSMLVDAELEQGTAKTFGVLETFISLSCTFAG